MAATVICYFFMSSDVLVFVDISLWFRSLQLILFTVKTLNSFDQIRETTLSELSCIFFFMQRWIIVLLSKLYFGIIRNIHSLTQLKVKNLLAFRPKFSEKSISKTIFRKLFLFFNFWSLLNSYINIFWVFLRLQLRSTLFFAEK